MIFGDNNKAKEALAQYYSKAGRKLHLLLAPAAAAKAYKESL